MLTGQETVAEALLEYQIESSLATDSYAICNEESTTSLAPREITLANIKIRRTTPGEPKHAVLNFDGARVS